MRFVSLSLVIVALFQADPVAAQQSPVTFKLKHTGGPEWASVGGRVFVVVSRKEIGSGVFSQSWFTPEPFFAQNIKPWPADAEIEFRPEASFPGPIADLKAGSYFVQAIYNPASDQSAGQNPLTSPGNLFSKPQKIDIDPKSPAVVSLTLNQIVSPKAFKETDRVKLFEMESPILKAVNAGTGNVVRLRAGVVLPKSFGKDPKRTYPVIYDVPGFGGDHHMAFKALDRDTGGVEMIHVMLDPACRLGHHVFADSANNGPVGAALVKDFIPALEKKYGGSGQRFVTGHSSGGWSSLWLQITYPEFFDGVWSTAPDSVDFRDFQLVNVYEDANLLFDPKGSLRPLARKDGKNVLTTKQFSDMEVVFGRGGQLFSFEAVFSPSEAGSPRKLWDRSTGAIDRSTAQSWQAYDIRRILEKNWPTLGPKLQGKLHVIMGAEDTFFLDGATRLLKQSLEKLGSDAVIEIVPGRHHGNLLDAGLRQRIGREMAARVK